VSKGQNTPGIARGRFRSYPQYKDSGVKWLATVPASWRICAVKHRFDIFLGKMLQPEPASAHDLQVPYLKAANVQWENIGLGSLQTMWASKDEIQTGQVAMGDLLVCEGGEVGRAAILTQKPEEPTIIQNALHRVRSQSEMPKFLMYLLEVSASGGWLEVECNKATIQHFTCDKFGSLRIALPSLDEQCRIVSFLDRETAKIDALIEKKERLIDLLQEKRAALITQAVTKGLDPTVPMKDSGVEWLGKIPAHWNVKRIKTVACLNTGGTPAGLLDEAFELEGVPWVKPDHLNGDHGIIMPDRRLSLSAAKAVGIIEAGSSLVCGIGTVGKTGHAPFIVCTNQQINAITFGCKVTNRFGQFIVSCLSQEFMRRANKVTLAICNKSEMGEVFICTPPLTEQRAVAAFLDRETAKIGTLLAKTHEAIDRLKEYRTALISAAVTGKIDVRDVGSKKRSDEN